MEKVFGEKLFSW